MLEKRNIWGLDSRWNLYFPKLKKKLEGHKVLSPTK
jgi:hypothetical protein